MLKTTQYAIDISFCFWDLGAGVVSVVLFDSGKVGRANKCPSMSSVDPSLNAVLKTV